MCMISFKNNHTTTRDDDDDDNDHIKVQCNLEGWENIEKANVKEYITAISIYCVVC